MRDKKKISTLQDLYCIHCSPSGQEKISSLRLNTRRRIRGRNASPVVVYESRGNQSLVDGVQEAKVKCRGGLVPG